MDSRTLLALLILAASLSAAELIRGASPWFGAAVLVVLGAVVACAVACVVRMPPASSVALGVVAALAYGVLRPVLPALAWGLLVGCLWLERCAARRGQGAWVFHVLLGALVGGLTHAIARRVLEPEGAAQLVRLVGAFAFVVAPLWVRDEAPHTAALRGLARRSEGASRVRLLRAAAQAPHADRGARDGWLWQLRARGWAAVLRRASRARVGSLAAFASLRWMAQLTPLTEGARAPERSAKRSVEK